MEKSDKIILGLVTFALGFFVAVGVVAYWPAPQQKIVVENSNVGSGNISLMGSVQKADIIKFNLTSSTKQLGLFTNNDADGTKRVLQSITLYFDNLATSTGEGPIFIQAGTSTNGTGSGSLLNSWNLTSVGSSSTVPVSVSTSSYPTAILRTWGYSVNLVVSSSVTLATGTTGYAKAVYDKVPQVAQ